MITLRTLFQRWFQKKNPDQLFIVPNIPPTNLSPLRLKYLDDYFRKKSNFKRKISCRVKASLFEMVFPFWNCSEVYGKSISSVQNIKRWPYDPHF